MNLHVATTTIIHANNIVCITIIKYDPVNAIIKNMMNNMRMEMIVAMVPLHREDGGITGSYDNGRATYAG